jgi:hypothetical protein
MVFTVFKVGPSAWAVFSPTGTKLDVKKTKAAAITLASIMAGWAGKVVVKA